MPIAFPVSEIIDEAIEVIGNCNRDKLYTKITRAVEVLANKGEWDILTKQVDICAQSDGCTVALPRDVRSILACNHDGRPMFMRNKWYEFHYNGSGSKNTQVPWAWDNQELSPVFMDIINASPLIAIADLKTDLSGRIRIFGYDQNGKWIRTQQPDGTWIDGFYMVINVISDYPMGLITPDTNRRFIRNFVPTPVTDILCNIDHDFTTGAAVVLSLITPPLPTPLVNGKTYYARVIDDTHVSLHATADGALTNSGKIALTSVNSASVISLSDRRAASVLTKFNSATKHDQRDGMIVTFTAGVLPTPIETAVEYFSHVLDDNNFTVHETLEEAVANLNPIDVSTPGTAVVASARQEIDPITWMDFSVNHNFTTGDAVKASNTTGALPEPLLPQVTYYVKYVSSTRVTLHTTLADATTGANPIVLFSSGTGSTSLVKTIPCSANIGTQNNISCQGHGLTVRTAFSPLTTATRARASNVSTLTFATPHGYATGDVVKIETVGGSDYNTDKAVVTVTSTTAFTYSNIGGDEGSAGDTAGRVTKFDAGGDLIQFSTSGTFPLGITQGTVYKAEPAMSADSFSLFTTDISPVEINTAGSGQLYLVISRVFTVGFNSNWKTIATKITTADIVRVSATGALPSTSPQVDSSTNYFARKIDDQTVQLFTSSALALDSAARITGSRARSSNVATITTGSAHGFSTNDFVDISGVQLTNDGVLATAAVNAGGSGYVDGESVELDDGSSHRASAIVTVSGGAITFFRVTDGGSGFLAGSAGAVIGGSGSSGTWNTGTITNGVSIVGSTYNKTRVQITVTGATTFTYPSIGLNEPTTVDVGGSVIYSDIKVNSVGVGDVSLVFNRTVTAMPASNLMKLDSSQYLTDGGVIRFESDGTLPSPLLPATDYHFTIEGGYLKTLTTLDVEVVLLDIGSGSHDMVIARNFTTPIPTDFIVSSNNFNNGDAVKAETTGTLPSPLIINTNYYVRRLDDDTIELYDTSAHAIDTAGTTGRISPVNTGSGAHTLVQLLSAINVSRITRVMKSVTKGFMKVYAWDNGRADALTMIGDYFPDETEPLYRRIKLASTCPWIRIAFKQDIFKITSDDDLIPIPSPMAVIMMLKSLNLQGTEFSQDGDKFEQTALRFLSDAQTSLDGPDAPTIQINDGITTDPRSKNMDTGWGWNGGF